MGEFKYLRNITYMNMFFDTDLCKELLEKNKKQEIKNIINYCWIEENGKKQLKLYISNGDYNEHFKKLEKIDELKILKKREKPPETSEKIYWDPDTTDEELYKVLYTKIDNNDLVCNKCLLYNEKLKINLSSDALIGWKAIMDVVLLEKQDIKKVTEIYKILRNPDNNVHLLWPKHEIPTINTERYQQFNDRVDYTLYDIKKFYDIPKKFRDKLPKITLLKENISTYNWLNSFANFSDFIKKMNLEKWCKFEKNKKEYEVINLSKDIRNCKEDYYPIIEDYLPEEHKVIKDYGAKVYSITKEYINNLIWISSKKDIKDEIYL